MKTAPIFRITASNDILNSADRRGRHISDYTWDIRCRVINYLRANHGKDISTKMVYRSIKQNKKKVLIQLKWLEEKGAIQRVSKTKDNFIVWRNIVIDEKEIGEA